VVILVCVLFFKARRIIGLSRLQEQLINALAVIVLCQFTLGVLTLIYSVPVLLGVLHQTGAFVLFGTSLFLIHSLSRKGTGT
jgi:cytochrome c oxidase assembly protein subunit 15